MSDTPGPVLVAEGVTHRLGGATVLRDVSLTVAPGTLVVLAGRSGSGKSTFCHLAAGLDDPTSGRLEVAGDVFDWGVVSLLPQRLALVEELTVAENVRMPVLLRRGGTDDSAELVERLGLGALAGRRAAQTSLGEQQRAALARALVLRPMLAVLDEPTSHQDDEHAEDVVAALGLARDRGTAVLVATHDEQVLAAADVVIRLSDGAVVS